LFQQSVTYTLQHPLFGVGPDQFANFEGHDRTSQGQQGLWHATHSSFTQVSSECGIPALIFFLCGIGSAVVLVARVYRQARRKAYKDLANASLCYLASMAGFLGALTFLSGAYTFELPAMVGLGIAISMGASREMAARSSQARFAPASPVWSFSPAR
jgi:O-antigen ligase